MKAPIKKFKLGFDQNYYDKIANDVTSQQTHFNHYEANMKALGLDPFLHAEYDKLEAYVTEALVKGIENVPGFIDKREVLKLAKKEWILLDILELRYKVKHLQFYAPGAMDAFKESCIRYTEDPAIIERCERIKALEKEMMELGVQPQTMHNALAQLGYNRLYDNFNAEYIKGMLIPA